MKTADVSGFSFCSMTKTYYMHPWRPLGCRTESGYCYCWTSCITNHSRFSERGKRSNRPSFFIRSMKSGCSRRIRSAICQPIAQYRMRLSNASSSSTWIYCGNNRRRGSRLDSVGFAFRNSSRVIGDVVRISRFTVTRYPPFLPTTYGDTIKLHTRSPSKGRFVVRYAE